MISVNLQVFIPPELNAGDWCGTYHNDVVNKSLFVLIIKRSCFTNNLKITFPNSASEDKLEFVYFTTNTQPN